MATRDADAWRRATTSPFLDGIRSGNLPEDAFVRWLEQDRIFLVGLTRAWAGVLTSAPEMHHDLLASGIRAFVDEVSWLGEHVPSGDLGSVEPLGATTAYVDWLLDVASAPFAVAMSALWVVEAAYLEAWRGVADDASRMNAAHSEFVAHWSNAEFGEFVDTLEEVADAALAGSDDGTRSWASVAVATTLAHEEAFWGMTVTG